MSYEEQIKAIGTPTIDDFIHAAASMVPANLKDMPWHCPDESWPSHIGQRRTTQLLYVILWRDA